MFPVRESRRYLATALAALLISAQTVILGLSLLYYTSQPSDSVQSSKQQIIQEASLLEDNTSIVEEETTIIEVKTTIAEATLLEEPSKKEISSLEETPFLKEKIIKTETSEKLIKLAQEYKAEPEYLDYIVKVERIFGLEPCELLALIAQESGFKPQTRMDGGSLSYSTTQMKMPTAKTAHMAITEYYKMEIPYPTDQLLREDPYYAAFLAGGYLKYLQDSYQDKFEAYTAYNWGIGGRMVFYKKNGHFKSPYAIKLASLGDSFSEYVGQDYELLSQQDFTIDELAPIFKG